MPDIAPSRPLPSFDEPTEPGYERHIVELDGIRGLAALAVVFHHIAQHTIEYEHGIARVVLFLCQLGFLGVDVFFALSGFLITRILLHKRTSPHYYRNFYARRLLRLAPPYLLTLAIVALFVPDSRSYLLLSLVYLANVPDLFHIPLSYGVLWSLSVEEHFYFLWPWLTRLLSPRRLAALCIAICLLTPIGRLLAIHCHILYTYYSWYRFDGLAWGALLAIRLHEANKDGAAALKTLVNVLTRAGGAVFLLASILFVTFRFGTAYCLYYTAIPMLTTALIARCVSAPLRQRPAASAPRCVSAPLRQRPAASAPRCVSAPLRQRPAASAPRCVSAPLRQRPAASAPRILRSRVLRFFGDISYWLYLIHYFFLLELQAWLKSSHPALLHRGGLPLWLAMTAGVLLPSIASGIFVRRYVELPILRRKAAFT